MRAHLTFAAGLFLMAAIIVALAVMAEPSMGSL